MDSTATKKIEQQREVFTRLLTAWNEASPETRARFRWQTCAVLIVSHADHHIEVYGPPGVDVHIARMPVSFSVAAEDTAEAVMELLLPMRFRELYRRDYLRDAGTTRPLLSSTLAASKGVPSILADIEALPKRIRDKSKLAREGRRPE